MKVLNYGLWTFQLLCLATILYCSWQLFDHEVFALVAASVGLLASFYVEWGLPYGTAEPTD